MALTKPLAEHTLRELLEALSDEQLRHAGGILEAVRASFGLPLTFTAAPGADVTDRITRDAGVVRQELLQLIRDGRAFTIGSALTPAAGQFAHLQLFNPVTSLVRVLVYGVDVLVPVAGTVTLRRHNAALPTLVFPGENLLIGGAVSVAQVRADVPAAVPIAGSVNMITSLPLLANTWHSLQSAGWFAELPPGQGIYIGHSTAVAVLNVKWLWVEVPA